MSFKGIMLKAGISLQAGTGIETMTFSNGAVFSKYTTTAGVKLTDNIVAENDRILYLSAEAENISKGARQGVLYIGLDRQTTQAMTGWDGNPDCGLKIAVNNRAANTIARNGVRAFDIQARNRSTNAWVKTMELNGRNDSGANTVSIEGLHIRLENYGQVDDSITGLHIELSSENDTSSPTKDAILIRNTDQSGMTAVGAVLKVSHTSTNGFTNLLDLATASGDCAEAYNAAGTGAYSIKCKINNVTTYIHTYDAP
jgi:hypothetical protein